jgi:hypothetical protein
VEEAGRKLSAAEAIDPPRVAAVDAAQMPRASGRGTAVITTRGDVADTITTSALSECNRGAERDWRSVAPRCARIVVPDIIRRKRELLGNSRKSPSVRRVLGFERPDARQLRPYLLSRAARWRSRRRNMFCETALAYENRGKKSAFRRFSRRKRCAPVSANAQFTTYGSRLAPLESRRCQIGAKIAKLAKIAKENQNQSYLYCLLCALGGLCGLGVNQSRR